LYVAGLRTLLALDDLELDVVAFLQALVTLRRDSAVVDEDIWTVIAADEPEPLGVIEPFHFAFNARHLPSSVLALRLFAPGLTFVANQRQGGTGTGLAAVRLLGI
jgi:hypothetical protein